MIKLTNTLTELADGLAEKCRNRNASMHEWNEIWAIRFLIMKLKKPISNANVGILMQAYPEFVEFLRTSKQRTTSLALKYILLLKELRIKYDLPYEIPYADEWRMYRRNQNAFLERKRKLQIAAAFPEYRLHIGWKCRPSAYVDWIEVTDFADAISYIKERKYMPVFISFTYDDCSGIFTGYDFAKWLIGSDIADDFTFPEKFNFNLYSKYDPRDIEKLLRNYLNTKKEK